MRFTWDENKRRSNLVKHGFDFIDAEIVFEGATFTYEDDRFAYWEQRFVTLGLLDGIVVAIARSPIQNARTNFISFQCEKGLNVNNASSSRRSQTDWHRIHAMQDEEIDCSEIPETTEAQIAQAVLRIGGVPVDRSKQQVSLCLDTFIIEYSGFHGNGVQFNLANA